MASEANEAMEQQAPTQKLQIYKKGMADPSNLCWFLLALLLWPFSLTGFFNLWRRFAQPVDVGIHFVREVVMISSLFFICFSYANGRNEPRRLVGCHVKWVYNLIIVCTAITVQKCHGYDGNVVLAMVGYNMEFHALAKLWNIADVGFLDMLLGVLMQTIIFYMVNETYVVLILVVMLCGAIIYYQYWFYSTPTTCVTVLPKEEDLKDLNPPV